MGILFVFPPKWRQKKMNILLNNIEFIIMMILVLASLILVIKTKNKPY